MGLSLETYLDLTPFEFREAHRRFIERIEKDREASELNEWRRTRWLAWVTGNFDRNKAQSEFDILELPHDNELRAALEKKKHGESEASSRERFEALKNKWR